MGSFTYPAALIPSSGAYFGAYVAPRDGEDPEDAVHRLESAIGRKLAIDHQYHRWNEAIPTARQDWDASTGRLPFINWIAAKADGSPVRWSEIADGSQDDWIVQRADAVKAFGSPIYLAFHHEPEDDLAAWGTPEDYAAAFRRVVTVFRSRGVTNVAFVWTMMNWTFEPQSGRDPSAYYPGDSYVDIIGVDGYNWYPGRDGAPWQSFEQIFQTSNRLRRRPQQAVDGRRDRRARGSCPTRSQGTVVQGHRCDSQKLASAEGCDLLRRHQGARLEHRFLGVLDARVRCSRASSLHGSHAPRGRRAAPDVSQRPRSRAPGRAGPCRPSRGPANRSAKL